MLSFPYVSVEKNLPAMQKAWVQSLDKEDALEKEMETHSSIFIWEVPWTEKRSLEGYSPCCYKRVSNNLATKRH